MSIRHMAVVRVSVVGKTAFNLHTFSSCFSHTNDSQTHFNKD